VQLAFVRPVSKFSRADSRVKLFLKSDVSETTSLAGISTVMDYPDGGGLRNVRLYKIFDTAGCPCKLQDKHQSVDCSPTHQGAGGNVFLRLFYVSGVPLNVVIG
jgi:hypothetical protein